MDPKSYNICFIKGLKTIYFWKSRVLTSVLASVTFINMTEHLNINQGRAKKERVMIGNFRKIIKNHVLCLLDGYDLTFEEILERSLNCDPLLLSEVIDELCGSKLISTTNNQEAGLRYQLRHWKVDQDRNPSLFISKFSNVLDDTYIFKQARNFKILLGSILKGLPEPGPVYSQWWFSEPAYEKLTRLLSSLSKSHASIAFLGSPTLGSLFSHFSKNPTFIFDIDGVLLENLKPHSSETTRLVCYDALKEPEKNWEGKFQLVYTDPPWSISVLTAFLIRATSFINKEGRIAISFPQLLTRPSALSERKNLITLTQKLGLTLEMVLPGFTEYAVPIFEYNAYRHCGIELRKPWRKGDLFILKRSGAGKEARLNLDKETSIWDQFQYGKARIFLKRDGCNEYGTPSIKPLVDLEDLIYKSTSSRSSSWKSASLVSTRNCIAHAYGRKELSLLLRDILSPSSRHYKGKQNPSLTTRSSIEKTVLSMLNTFNSGSY